MYPPQRCSISNAYANSCSYFSLPKLPPPRSCKSHSIYKKASLPYASLLVAKRRHLKEGEKNHTMHLWSEQFCKRNQKQHCSNLSRKEEMVRDIMVTWGQQETLPRKYNVWSDNSGLIFFFPFPLFCLAKRVLPPKGPLLEYRFYYLAFYPITLLM